MGVPVNTLDPSLLGVNALGAYSQGSWLSTAGAGLGTVSDAIAGAYQAQVARNNAALATADAAAAEAAGTASAEQVLMKTGQTVSAQKAQQAGNNIDVSSGSARAVRDATEGLGEYDAAIIRYNAEREAYARRTEASSYRQQALFDDLATGFNLGRDALKTYSTFLSSSNALQSARLGMKAYGVGYGLSQAFPKLGHRLGMKAYGVG